MICGVVVDVTVVNLKLCFGLFPSPYDLELTWPSQHGPSVPNNKMAAGFSGALQLTDLNDFITPSQVNIIECYTGNCYYIINIVNTLYFLENLGMR